MFSGLNWSGIHNELLFELRCKGSHECTNVLFSGLNWSGIHNELLFELRCKGSHECTNGMFLGLDWRKEFMPRAAWPRMHECFVFGAKLEWYS